MQDLRRKWCLCLVVILIVGAWQPVGALETGQYDRQIATALSMMVERNHVSRHDLDDEISNRGWTLFLKRLDARKVYFYQSDVEAFRPFQNDLDDMLKEGDTKFAYRVFNRFLERVDERVALVDDLLAEIGDFSKEEYFTVDRELAKYPEDAEEARELYRLQLKYDWLMLKSDKVEDDEIRDRISRRYRSFAKRMHQLDEEELLEMYLTAVTRGYDPHTTYMSLSTWENFQIMMRLNLEGIGAVLTVEDGYTVVRRVVPGGAADKQGELKADDKIVSVGQGETGEAVDVVDMPLKDVVKMIRGKAGSVVRLGVLPASGTGAATYKITRAKIELNESRAQGEVLEDFGSAVKPDGSPYRIGYINLPSFYVDLEGARRGVEGYRSSTADVRNLLEDFDEQAVDAVVLDLRQNGGGSLTEAIHLTGLFIDRGPVVQVKNSRGRVSQHYDKDAGMAWEGPLVILTSKFSASASEILAGAIQDYRRGVMVGDTSTHGKGTVQNLVNLAERVSRQRFQGPVLGILKVTEQKFYRANGASTQKRGVHVDIVLPALTDHMDVGEADLEYAVAFDSVAVVDHDDFAMVNAGMLNRLRNQSEIRQQASDDFSELGRRIQAYRAQKELKQISLQESDFLARRAELEAAKEADEELEEAVDSADKKVERDFYLNEVLAITLNYIQELNQIQIQGVGQVKSTKKGE
ncbi:MAG: carboxy terminal-processing peptidase [bacterium]|nr:carboxy terminal-processing peptidase [bacterium]